MTQVYSAVRDAFDVILQEHGETFTNESKGVTFTAVFNPVYNDETYAGLRVTKRNYSLTMLADVAIDYGDIVTLQNRRFKVAPREAQVRGVVGLDEIAKKIRVIEI